MMLPPPHLLHSWQREPAPPNSANATVATNPTSRVIVEPTSSWLALLYLIPGLAIIGAGIALHFLARDPHLRLAGLWIALAGVICLLGSGAETRRRQVRRRRGGRFAQTSSYAYGRGTQTPTNRSAVGLMSQMEYQQQQQNIMWDRRRDEDIQMQYQAQQNYQVQQQQMNDWYR